MPYFAVPKIGTVTVGIAIEIIDRLVQIRLQTKKFCFEDKGLVAVRDVAGIDVAHHRFPPLAGFSACALMAFSPSKISSRMAADFVGFGTHVGDPCLNLLVQLEADPQGHLNIHFSVLPLKDHAACVTRAAKFALAMLHYMSNMYDMSVNRNRPRLMFRSCRTMPHPIPSPLPKEAAAVAAQLLGPAIGPLGRSFVLAMRSASPPTPTTR